MVSSTSALSRATILAQLILVACCRGTTAFTPQHFAARPSAGFRSNPHGEHRIRCPNSRNAQYPSMRASEDAHNGLGHEEGGDRSSTRLDFGVGLGATAAAVLLGGRSRQALAEDVVAEGGEGAASATAAAVSTGPVDAAPVVAAAVEGPALRDLGFEVPYTGKMVPLNKFIGAKATLVVNPKIDDPESLHQVGVGGATAVVQKQYEISSSSRTRVQQKQSCSSGVHTQGLAAVADNR